MDTTINGSDDVAAVMGLLKARVPLALLIDLAQPAGPDSFAIYHEREPLHVQLNGRQPAHPPHLADGRRGVVLHLRHVA